MPIPVPSQSVKESQTSSRSRLPEPSVLEHNTTRALAGSNPASRTVASQNTTLLTRTAPTEQRDKHVRNPSVAASQTSRPVNTSTSRTLPTSGLTVKSSLTQKPSANSHQPRPVIKGQGHATKPLTTTKVESQPKASNRIDDHTTPSIEEAVLQLSLVHEQASKALRLRQQTVNANILNERRSLEARHDHIVHLERVLQQRLNHAELSSWLNSSDHRALPADRIRDLTFCLSEIAELTCEGGLIDGLNQEFEEWYIEAHGKLQECRPKSGTSRSAGNVELVNPLGSVWHKRSISLHDRLVVCRQTLSSLGHALNVSILARVVQKHVMLVDILIGEIQLYDELQRKMIAQQGAWISATLTDIISTQQAIAGNDQPCPRIGLWDSPGSS